MKRYLSIIILLTFVLCDFTAKAGNESDTLKVMSYNLRFGELSPIPDIAKYIASESPDIVAVQECDWATNRKNARHQNGVKFINELAYHSGMFGVYGKAIDYRGGYYGIGILSKYPVLKVERILLPNPEEHEQRALLVAEIELPDGKTLTFACTHLEVKTPESRMIQARFVEKQLKKVKGPVILAGDMNAEPGSPEMDYFLKNWKDLSNSELTYHTRKPEVKIDWIFAKPAGCIELLSADVKEDIMLSDHFPLIATIVISPEAYK